MKINQIIMGMLCLCLSSLAYSQRLVLEDAISLTNSYHKDYTQYENQLEFYKALNAEIKSTIDVLNGYVKIKNTNLTCEGFILIPSTKNFREGTKRPPLYEANEVHLADSLLFTQWSSYYSVELSNLDILIQDKKLMLESYKDVQYMSFKNTNSMRYYTADSVTVVKNDLYRLESKKNQIEIQRNLCYLSLLTKSIKEPDPLCKILVKIYDNFSNIYKNKIFNFTSFTNYTEKSLFGMTGSAIFTTVIEGLSKFIIDHIKKEAAVTATNYYQRLINQIDTNYVNLMEGVFPTTIVMFNNFESQDINSYVQSIKKAANEDLQNMVPNITNLIVHEKIKVPASIHDGTLLYKKLSESSAPYEFFRNVESSDFKNNWIDTVFNRAYVVSELLLIRKSNGTITYASPSYLDNYWENEFFKEAYVGLGRHKFSNKWNFNDNAMKDIIELSASFYKFSEAALDLSKSKASGDTTYYSKIGYMADCAIDLTEVIALKNSIVKLSDKDSTTTTKVLDAFKFGNQVYKSIYRKNYLTTVNLVLTKLFEYSDLNQNYSGEINLIIGAQELIKKLDKENIDSASLINKLNTSGVMSASIKKLINHTSINKKQFLADLDSLLLVALEHIANQRKLYELSSFIASVASIENSDDVKKIFENFALPVGSYSIKRKNAFSITFDTQPGLLIGISSDYTGKNKNSFAWGATVPVGFSFNFGIHSAQANLGNSRFRNNTNLLKHSISIFIPVIDLAAPVSFIAGATSPTDTLVTRELSMLKPMNIFSPGLFVNYGIPNAPLTVFGGFQYNPQIIKFNKTAGTENTTANGFRFSIGVSFDIPIFRIYSTRNYRIKYHHSKN